MLGLMRAEWLKITRQGTTKTVGAMMLVICVLVVVAFGVTVLSGDSLSGRQNAFNMMDFPNAFLSGIQTLKSVGILIAAVMFASVIGSEYSSDTWKNLLIRRHGRANFLGAKLAVVSLALVIIFAVSLLVMQLLSLALHAIVADTVAKDGIQAAAVDWGQFWHSLVVGGVPMLLNLAVAAAIAAMCAVIGRSTVAGIMLTIVWNLVDSLVPSLLSGASGFTLNKNLEALGKNLDVAGSGAIPVWQSLVVTGIYLIVPLVVGIVVFRKRDMAGN